MDEEAEPDPDEPKAARTPIDRWAARKGPAPHWDGPEISAPRGRRINRKPPERDQDQEWD